MGAADPSAARSMAVAKAWGSPAGASRQSAALTPGVLGRTSALARSKMSCVAQKRAEHPESFRM